MRTRRGVPGRNTSVRLKRAHFLSSRRKTQIWLHNFPATAVRPELQDSMASCLPSCALGDCDIDRRVRVVHRAVRNQLKRTTLRSVVTEIDLDIMIAREALILAATEGIEVFRRE